MPRSDRTGFAPVNGIRMYYAVFNSGGADPVVLLHGGTGHSDHWGNQVPVLAARHKVIVADSRGHGRSTGTDGPFSYAVMTSDVLALLDYLEIDGAAIVGSSDGAIIGLDIAIHHPTRVAKLWAEGANSNPAGIRDPSGSATVQAAGERAAVEYARMSPTPDDFQHFMKAIIEMWSTQPNFVANDFARIVAPTAIVAGEYDELVKRENTLEIAALIPAAQLIILPEVSHFGAWQDPGGYNAALVKFLDQ